MSAPLRLEMDELPQSIVWDRPASDDQLERLCTLNDVLQIERTKEGEVRVHAPTGLLTTRVMQG